MTEKIHDLECPLCHGSGRVQVPEIAILEDAVARMVEGGSHPPVKPSPKKPVARNFLITQDDVKQMSRRGIRTVDQAVSLIRRLAQDHSDYQVVDVAQGPDESAVVTIMYRIPQVDATFNLFGIQFQEIVDEDNQEGGE